MKALGILTATAIGDAYGAGFEFTGLKFRKKHNHLRYIAHPKYPEHKAGCYTDDTQMSIAIARIMIGAPKGLYWTPFVVADAFARTFQENPIDGYARGFQSVLDDLDTSPGQAGWAFLGTIMPHSTKAGGAMRAGPLGLYPDPDVVRDRAMMQAGFTHATQEGMESAAAVALAVHHFYYGGKRESLPEFLAEHIRSDMNWVGMNVFKAGNRGYEVVRSAITAVMTRHRMSNILRDVVAAGGDTDTVAAIAMAIACYCSEIENDLPEALWDDLENGTHGRDALRKYETQLHILFPVPEHDAEDPDDYNNLSLIFGPEDFE